MTKYNKMKLVKMNNKNSLNHNLRNRVKKDIKMRWLNNKNKLITNRKTNKETSNNKDKTCKMIKHLMGNKTLVFMVNNLTKKIKIWKITKTSLINSNSNNSKSNSEMLTINNPKKLNLKR
jgi:hypothetical protein